MSIAVYKLKHTSTKDSPQGLRRKEWPNNPSLQPWKGRGLEDPKQDNAGKRRKGMRIREVTLNNKVTLAHLTHILKTKNIIKQQNILYCISTRTPPSLFSSLLSLGITLVLPCCLCWKAPTRKGHCVICVIKANHVNKYQNCTNYFWELLLGRCSAIHLRGETKWKKKLEKKGLTKTFSWQEPYNSARTRERAHMQCPTG